ncbi:Glu/Leu/Phe/Val dehydrogenase dimerization domain-containing protein [Kitasatospora sp. KL5]|uniref:Glu/Leu/Phe/Val dehydrogenase dimerization domain-containing protein n=1 Tax=Kitasatospora sp. KL5 TaxID=3425125 RepID=UPI003D6F2017
MTGNPGRPPGGASPLLATSLTSPADGLTGWVVVDSLVDGAAMGGTRMTGTVTEAEVTRLARAMTTKLALAGLPIGGAKAGLRSPGNRPGDRERALRAFGRSAGPLLRGGVYLGCDLGTRHSDRNLFFTEAGYDARRIARTPRLPADWAELCGRLTDITGSGVAVAALTAARDRLGDRPCRVTVQGFGTVGRAVARTLERHGHRVVAVADAYGTVHDPDGLPVDRLAAATDHAGTIAREALPDSVARYGGLEAWLDIDTDVLVLAATGDAVRGDTADRVRAQVVVEGGNLCCTPGAAARLAERGITLVPDVVANVGAAAAVGALLTGRAPAGLTTDALVHSLFDLVAETVRRNTRDVLEITGAGGTDPVPALLAHRRKAA